MTKRTIGQTRVQVHPLGFGCMRFPCIGEGNHNVDRPAAYRLLHEFLDLGGTYFDTAYVYHGGNSETVLGEALKQVGRRSDVVVATKFPFRDGTTAADFDRVLGESLHRLQTDYVDFYLLHGTGRSNFDKASAEGYFTWIDKQVQAGKVRYPSCSFHDNAEAFRYVMDAYPFRMTQVQMSILDTNEQATLPGMLWAAHKGVGIVVMEPLRGGALAGNLPDNVQAVYDRTGLGRSAADWAFRYLLNMPEVNVILSGMNTHEQLHENMGIFSGADAGCLTAQEQQVIQDVREAYQSRIRVPCTACRYCMPCPQGVEIPGIFQGANRAAMFNTQARFAERYERLTAEGKAYPACVRCGSCEAACPQHIKVPDELEAIHASLA